MATVQDLMKKKVIRLKQRSDKGKAHLRKVRAVPEQILEEIYKPRKLSGK